MARFTLRRLGAALVLLFVVLTATFFLLHLAPGEPGLFFSDPRISFEQQQRLRALYGLDQPLLVQYGHWMSAALRGEWGTSFSYRRSAAAVLAERFPNTVVLALGILIVEYGVGFALGMLAAVHAGRRLDHLVRIVSLVLFAVPSFWLAILLLDLLAVRAGLFPVGEMSSIDAPSFTPLGRLLDVLHHLVLPALALGLARSGSVVRFLRNGLLEVLGQDHVRTARAIGLGRARILWVHALKNAVGPLVQRFGVSLPALLSGTVLVELVFTWPGLGQLALAAVQERDYPLVLAATALAGVLVVVASFLTDLLHAWVDPRIRAHVS